MPNFFNMPFGLQAGSGKSPIEGNFVKFVSTIEDLTFRFKIATAGEVKVQYTVDGNKHTESYTITDPSKDQTVIITHDAGTSVFVIGDITNLTCSECGITSLSVNKCQTIQEVYAEENLLTRFDASKNPTLWLVNVSDNPGLVDFKFGSRDLSLQCQLYVDGTGIKKIDMSGVGMCDIVHGGSYDEIISSRLMTLREEEGQASSVQTLDTHMIAYPLVYKGTLFCGIISASGNMTILDKEKFISDLPTAPVEERELKVVYFADMSPEQNARIQAKGWSTEQPG